MRPNTVVFLKESALAAVAFVAGQYLFYWASFVGIQDFFEAGPIRDYLESGGIHFELVFTGVTLGVLVVVVDRLTDRPRFRRHALLTLVVLKTLVFLVGTLLLQVMVALMLPLVGVSWSWLREGIAEMTPVYVGTILLEMVALAFVISFGIQVRRLVGPGVFWPLLIGRYQRPRTEAQLFLFMDLKSSTTLAESMGHERYSALLQSCFRDLTDVALRNQARVYQYVGDEVVLHWPASDPESAPYAVRAYFEFVRALEDRAREYERTFGAIPVFRGGAGAGDVTVVEIGEIKRSLAFHGDPLNTAARILELCKRNDGQLFVHEDIWSAVASDPAYESSWEGEVILRGKGEQVHIRGLAKAG